MMFQNLLPILILTCFGLLKANFIEKLFYFLTISQLSVLITTLYLHRSMAHRSVDFNKYLNYFFRFYLWFFTGMVTSEWVGVHRKHHAFTERMGDPHSPKIFGIKKILLNGVDLYKNETKNKKDIEKYSVGCPNDKMECFYKKYYYLGPILFLILNFILFGFIGIFMWSMQIIWIPFWAAGFINGIGHFAGYRNFETDDESRNILFFGFFLGGEELHNNHHAFPSSAKFSFKESEFDFGWGVIKIFEFLKLCKILRIYPKWCLNKGVEKNIESDRTYYLNKLEGKIEKIIEIMIKIKTPILTDFHKNVFMKTSFKNFKFQENEILSFKNRLKKIFEERDLNKMKKDLLKWIIDAIDSEIIFLKDFAISLENYKVCN